MEDCRVIAEVGCAHLGQMDRAKELITLAKLANAHYVKFQKRNPPESVPKHLQNKPHPNKIFAYGDTYLEHRMNLELSIEQHAELKKFCEEIGIGYSTSVWDMTSAKEVIELNPDHIKIPSACNTNFNLIDYIINNYAGEIHISSGMMTDKERIKFNKHFEPHSHRIIYYHCTSSYPCGFEHLHLNEIRNLKSFGKWKAIGFSDHGFGIVASVVGYVLGATCIERHFIDDRTVRHSDSSASLEPDGLRRLCRDLKAVQKALKYRENEMTEEELGQRKKLKTI